jgi:WD40 repeat protein
MSHCYVRNTAILFLLFCLYSTNAKSQIKSREAKKTYMKADKAFDYGDYPSALNLYKSIYVLDSNNSDLNYKIGMCMFEIKKYRRASLHYFEKTSASASPDVNYYLGWLYHLQRNYEKAVACYSQYKYFGDSEIHPRKEIDDLINKCGTAKLLESKEDRTLQIKNLGDTINTEYPEYAPLIPAQENYMMFTSRRKNSTWSKTDPFGDYFEDIYISKRENNKWLLPQMMDTVINTAVHDAGTGLSADGEKLLMYRTSKDLMSGDIYESNLISGKWTNPQALGAIVNDPEFLEPSACYSADGSTIFFSSNRPGGYGGKDLYLVKKLPNGNWAAPFNLGPTINTPYNEDAPFLHPVENTLFFSSEGHENMGGYDIFKSKFDDASYFSLPQNMGCPVNTVDDDIFFVLNTDASLGYLSSERQGGYGSQDLYSIYFPINNVPLNVYNIHVFDESGAVLTNVEILLTDMTRKAIYGMYKANQNTGKILVISPPESSYRVAIQAAGFEPYISNTILGSNNELVFKLKKITQ